VGRVPPAYVQLSRGYILTGGQLKAHLAGRLARYQVPKTVVTVDDMPRTSSARRVASTCPAGRVRLRIMAPARVRIHSDSGPGANSPSIGDFPEKTGHLDQLVVRFTRDGTWKRKRDVDLSGRPDSSGSPTRFALSAGQPVPPRPNREIGPAGSAAGAPGTH